MQALTRKRLISSISILSALLLIVVFLSLLFGSDALRPFKAIKTLIAVIAGQHDPDTDSTILLHIRLPRILLALIVGGSLAAAGGIFQATLKNPLADPYILGISSGAALGVIISLLTQIDINIIGFTSTTIMAFMGAIVALYIVYKLS